MLRNADSAFERIKVPKAEINNNSQGNGSRGHHQSDLRALAQALTFHFQNVAITEFDLVAGVILADGELVIVCLFETALEFVAVAQIDVHMILLVGDPLSNFSFYFR